MKGKKITIIVFVLCIVVGMVLVDTMLNAATKDCYCAEDYVAQQKCNLFCSTHGGCLFIYIEIGGCFCTFGIGEMCDCAWYYECEDRSKGYITTSTHCSNCYNIPGDPGDWF